MRRNFIPINNNRFQPVSSQSSVISHLNKMSSMMGRPNQTRAQTNNSQPSIRVSSNIDININMNNADDSDEDYFDDYILDESQSSQSNQSDDDYFQETVREKFDKDRPATIGEIGNLGISQIDRKIEGVCSICLEEWKLKEEFTALPCAHKFHWSCIKDWLEKRNKCPCCNSAVFE